MIKIQQLEEKVNKLLGLYADLNEKVSNLESRHYGTGVVLEGVPLKHKSFIEKSILGEKGE